MDVRLQTALRWVLVLVTTCVTSLIPLILLMGFMFELDRFLVEAFLVFNIAPQATVEAAHQLELFLAILTWIVPSTCAVSFATRTSQRKALHFGLSISILLFAALCFFLGWSYQSIWSEGIEIIAALAVLSVLVLSFFKLNLARFLTFANLAAVLLLFSPSLVELSRKTNVAPQPKQLWSSMLQQQEWQSMNTGSEYGAIRQVAFAGDRVVAVFDTGFAPSQLSKDKWPLSTYKLMSLDVKTGAKRNESTFQGRWGDTPYICSSQGRFISVQSHPPRLLNADLTPVANLGGTSSADRMTNQEQSGCDTRYDPPVNAQLYLGSYAGASANGQRFAMQSSYTEGDSPVIVYEYFTVYSVTNGNALATIHIKNFPVRQSWSAFSPDGRYFVAGNPNKLMMYELP